MGLTLTTPPLAEVISASEFKLHSRIDTSADDDKIAVLIEAAREYVESVTGRQFVNATYTLKLDRFPCGDTLELPKAPLSSVTSITYIDSAGASQTLSTDDYTVDTPSETYGRVYIDRATGWPATYDQRNAVTVVYVAGYGAAAANVPERCKQAVYLLAAHWYEHRESVITAVSVNEVPQALMSLINNLKIRGSVAVYESGLTTP